MRALVTGVAFALAFALSLAFADETEDNFVYVPARGAESLTVDQKLGRLTLRGWDQPEVRIRAHKHARDGATLDRVRVGVVMEDGQIFVQPGVRIGEVVRPLPVEGAGVDLEIDAPRDVKLRATTWKGDLVASGFNAGAVLDSTAGEVHVHDVRGRVHSFTLHGRQRLESIQGDVEAGGASGDLDLEAIGGEILVARVNDGQITVRHVTTPVVRLFSTVGSVVLVGELQRQGRYELTALDGDVRLEIAPAPFQLTARAGGNVRLGFAVRGHLLPHDPHVVTGEFRSGGAAAPRGTPSPSAQGGSSLDLTAVRGDVVIDRR